MRGYQAELADLGHAVTASDFSITLLTSLPKTWNAFIGSIDLSSLSDKADPDSSKIIARILEEDRRLREQGTTSDTALAAKPRGKVTCYLCGKLGHVIRDCPKKKAFDAFDANSPTTAGLAFTEPDADDDIPYDIWLSACGFFLDLRYGSPTGIDSDRAYAFVETSFVVYLSGPACPQGPHKVPTKGPRKIPTPECEDGSLIRLAESEDPDAEVPQAVTVELGQGKRAKTKPLKLLDKDWQFTDDNAVDPWGNMVVKREERSKALTAGKKRKNLM
ncbi:hypothetical protein K435DRAFT_792796 [Dendrothele bispora CBS 962.96]|uniref:CCHC-type domain-containing protein n=1 Tax=Dendrothele bispora (strain CBS 962.96) TaxID=1314807 RepID=A0A4S8MHG9_DENBC|nr:hypothetical protein K435DRAFT_792796 [Dendrothele bispora CBS 962.96]